MRTFHPALAALPVFAALMIGLQGALGSAGEVLLTLNTVPSRTLPHPDKHLIYVSALGTILAIDTINHTVGASVEIDGSPRGMALSEDGETLFVADNANPRIIVIDAEFKQAPVFLDTDVRFSSLAMGLNGRLFATKAASGSPLVIYEVNSATGETNQTFLAPVSLWAGGRLAITPDRTRLFWMRMGGSPTSLVVFDVSTSNISPVWSAPHGSLGSNGQHLSMSWQGDRISPSSGAPYSIPALSTETMQTLGTFFTGPYPRSSAYSPDGLVLYSAHQTTGTIGEWDAVNYTAISTIPFVGQAAELSVDRTGRVLVSRFHHQYNSTWGMRMISTGRVAMKDMDLNQDGVLDVFDLLILLVNWGPCDECPADLNWDGVVNSQDVAAFLEAWILSIQPVAKRPDVPLQ